jgi:O-antigen/teichoic acid export membrane protein
MNKISLNDLFWSYFSQFLNFGAGIITLPFVLKLLTTNEIAINYLILTAGSMVALLDLGFSTQFARSLTYLLSGSQKIITEGIYEAKDGASVNYKLIAILISTAKFFYLRVAFIALILMMTLGLFYFYKLTQGFTSIDNALLLWILYSFSVFFNLYYMYFNALLQGGGMIKELSIVTISTRLFSILITVILLTSGYGLISVILANFTSPFIGRHFAYNFFFKNSIGDKINGININKSDVKEMFKTLSVNGSKLGLIMLATFLGTKFSLFLSGMYLSFDQIASFGLMIQFVSILSAVSSNVFNVYLPEFASLQVKKNFPQLKKLLSSSMMMYYLLFILGGIFILFILPIILKFIGSNALLPNRLIVFLFLFITLLENNHAHFGSIILSKNSIPFVLPGLIAGVITLLGSYLVLEYTNFNLLGLVIVQGFSQALYNNWKWPKLILEQLNISFFEFVRTGSNELVSKFLSLKSFTK